jgi:hypothetical protein
VVSRVVVRALTFTLSHPETGKRLGLGLICAEARYASTAWGDGTNIVRTFVESADWQLFAFALRQGLPSTALESTHVVTRMLLPRDLRGSIDVQQLADRTIESTKPIEVPELLDGELRRQLAAVE